MLLQYVRNKTVLQYHISVVKITSNISDVDDVFVRRDLNDKYKVEKSIAEEFSDIYSFNPLLEASMLKKDEL